MIGLPPSELLLGFAGVACALAALAGLGLAVALLAQAARRWREHRARARVRALEGLGYVRTAERWVRSVDGVPVAFQDEEDGGWRWTGHLPRYLAVKLRIEERGDEWPPVAREGAFLAGDPELDDRFRFVADRSAPALALLATDGVDEALLALPFVDLAIGGDEIVLRDPARTGLARRARGRRHALAEELRIHREVGRLMVAFARFAG